MGKSDKKVKSDQINALRKRYDAFLEDDKKRKERNEYILEKLDKMRYCSAMVQVRQKPPAFTDRKASLYNMPEQTLDNPAGIDLDIPRTRIDEAVLLQEISKKYILIPKLRVPSYDNDFTKQTKPNIDANTDWKSKYEILDQLKRDEKEQDSVSPQEALLIPHQGDIENTYYDRQDDEPLEYKHELPVKLPPEHNTSNELQHYSNNDAGIDPNYHYDVHQLNDSTDNDVNSTNTGNNVYDEENKQGIVYDNTTQNTVFEQNTTKNIGFQQNNIEPTVYDDQQHLDTVYDQTPSKDNTQYVSIHEDNVNDDKYAGSDEKGNGKWVEEKENVESIQLTGINEDSNVENFVEMYPQINNENIQEGHPFKTESVNNHDIYVPKEEENNNSVDTDKEVYLPQEETVLQQENDASSKFHEINKHVPTEYDTNMPATNMDYPIESANVQDFTAHDNVQFVDGVNENSIPETLSGRNDVPYDHVETDNGNPNTEEPFNAEQNDGFYEQTEGYDYTTEGAENYNPEYSAPTENYPQNEEYAYYEGAQPQPDQPYTEINEHEGTSQQYDQSYEQQYENTYDQQAYQQPGYEQDYAQGYDQGYTEPQQQYEDQAQQDLQYQDNLAPQYVEQQLGEEGYTENANEKTEDSHVDNVMESQQIAAVESKATVQ